MKSERGNNYRTIQESVPFSGIFSIEQILIGRKLFLERIRQDKDQASRFISKESKAANSGAGAS